MKRITIIIFAVALGTIVLYSCKHTSPVEFTNLTMRPWFDMYCGGCHKTGAANANDWEYNPYDANTIQNHISTIYKEVYTRKSMPRESLPASQLDSFKVWYDARHASN